VIKNKWNKKEYSFDMTEATVTKRIWLEELKTKKLFKQKPGMDEIKVRFIFIYINNGNGPLLMDLLFTFSITILK